jgi:hypothetical protein
MFSVFPIQWVAAKKLAKTRNHQTGDKGERTYNPGFCSWKRFLEGEGERIADEG